MTIFSLYPSSYAGVVIPSRISVWELKLLKGQTGSHTVVFKHLSSRQLPTESSTRKREPNANEEQLSKESGVLECTQNV